MNSNEYKIRRQTIEISTSNYQEGIDAQSLAEKVFKERVLPGFEQCFDLFNKSDEVIVIDRIEIDLGTLSFQNFEKNFPQKAFNVLKAQLERIIGFDPVTSKSNIGRLDDKNPQDRHLPLLHHLLESFCAYLQKGSLPWSMDKSQFAEMETYLLREEHLPELIMQDKYLADFFVRTLQSNAFNPLTRLVKQYPVATLEVIFRALIYYQKEAVRKWISLLQEEIELGTVDLVSKALIKSKDIWFYSLLVASYAFEHSGPDTIKLAVLKGYDWLNIDREHWRRILLAVAARIQQERGLTEVEKPFQDALNNYAHSFWHSAKEVERYPEVNPGASDPTGQNGQITTADEKHFLWDEVDPLKNTLSKTAVEQDEIYLHNAGMVLLHPFLKELFTELNWLEQGKFLSEEVQQDAVFLLEYLVTGSANAREYDLVLNKVLCGLPIHYALKESAQFDPGVLEAADKLLRAVIKHWTALKNTSPDGLRSGFLLRNGKLSEGQQILTLQVEYATQDILLSKIPWGFSMVRFPWMVELLQIKWV